MERGERDAVSAEPVPAPADAHMPAAPAAGHMPLGAAGMGIDMAASLASLDPAARAGAVQRLQRRHGNRSVAQLVAREPAAPAGGAPPPAAPGDAAPEKKAAPGLIVPDDSELVEPNQMKRGAFLAELRAAVKVAADGAIAASGWGALLRGRAMEELESRLESYAGLDAAALEAAIRSEVPDAGGASSAAGLVPPVAQAVGRAVAEGMPQDAPPAAEIAGGLIGAVKGLLFKRRRGGDSTDDDPVAVSAQLGAGEELPGGVAARMGSALGGDFADVRIHTDARAARMADRFDARAFTVGSHVAFGSSEYRPGTVVGDALIAHELAHVAQQRGGSAAVSAAHAGFGDGALEADADDVAADALAALHAGAPARPSLARLRSGLRLQRCGYKTEKPKNPPAAGKTVAATMGTANDPSSGVFYWPQFRAMCEEGRSGYTWDDGKFRTGWSKTDLLEKTGPFLWRLKGKSASAALRAWLAGLTVADCASVAAASYYNSILARVGDERFDDYFKAGGEQALVIGQYPDELPLRKFLETPNRGSEELKEGDWYFFKNHPMYKFKHPAGLWQGENAVYLGNDQWAGFGATKSRAAMEAELVAQYNLPRDSDDQAKLAGTQLPFGKARLPDGSLPKELRMAGERGADGDGLIPVETTLKALQDGGGGLQWEGWRVSEKNINREFPK